MATESSHEGSSRKWPTILLTGLVSLAVGVGGALILDYVRTSAAKLEYEVLSSSAFSGQLQKIGMVAIEISNPGRKELELVSARILAKDATILESKTEGFPTKGLSEAKSTNSYSIELPFLNPSESGRILLLLNLSGAELVPPSVELRAKGIAGAQRTKERTEKKDKVTTFLVPLSAAFISLLSATASMRILRHRRGLGFTTAHSDDQRDVAAFVFDMCGLTEEADTLRSQVRKLQYWSIADAVTQKALTRNEPDHIRMVIAALDTLMKYAAVAETSCFLIHFDLARLYIRIAETDKARAALDLARKHNHKVIDKRIALAADLKPIAPAKLEVEATKPGLLNEKE